MGTSQCPLVVVGVCRGGRAAVAVIKFLWCFVSDRWPSCPTCWEPSLFCLLSPCPLLLKREFGVLHFPPAGPRQRRGVREACASLQRSTEEGSSWLGERGWVASLSFPPRTPDVEVKGPVASYELLPGFCQICMCSSASWVSEPPFSRRAMWPCMSA